MGVHGRPPLDRPGPHRRRHPARSVLIVLDRLGPGRVHRLDRLDALPVGVAHPKRRVERCTVGLGDCLAPRGGRRLRCVGRGRASSIRSESGPAGPDLVDDRLLARPRWRDRARRQPRCLVQGRPLGADGHLDRCCDVGLADGVASLRGAMGQPVTLITTSSPRPGILRFELNRSLTGMGHVRYEMGDEIRADDPASELAKRLFDAGGVSAVHVYGSMVTVTLASSDFGDLETVIGGLYSTTSRAWRSRPTRNSSPWSNSRRRPPPADAQSAQRRTQACIAMPAATPALMLGRAELGDGTHLLGGGMRGGRQAGTLLAEEKEASPGSSATRSARIPADCRPRSPKRPSSGSTPVE